MSLSVATANYVRIINIQYYLFSICCDGISIRPHTLSFVQDRRGSLGCKASSSYKYMCIIAWRYSMLIRPLGLAGVAELEFHHYWNTIYSNPGLATIDSQWPEPGASKCPGVEWLVASVVPSHNMSGPSLPVLSSLATQTASHCRWGRTTGLSSNNKNKQTWIRWQKKALSGDIWYL